MATEWPEKELADLLRSARAVPKPRAKQKALAAMVEAARLGASRTRVTVSRRKLFAAAFAAVLIATGFCLAPKRHTIALADVARAMGQVQSAHLVGWMLDPETGSHRRMEMWVKGPTKYRERLEGLSEAADDGTRLVTLSGCGPVRVAEIRPPGGYPGLEEGMTYLDLFRRAGLQDYLTKAGGLRVTGSSWVKMPDGKNAVQLVLTAPDEPESLQVVVAVDPDTDLVVQWERYDGGELYQKAEWIEYDLEIPDSTFHSEMPEDAVVADFFTPQSSELVAQRERVVKEMRAAGVRFFFQAGTTGMVGGEATWHTKLHIRSLDNNGMALAYLPERNAYYVAGKALAWMDDGSGWWQVVEDEELAAPKPPDSTPDAHAAKEADTTPPACTASRETEAKERKAAGWRCVAKICSGKCSSQYHKGLWFKVLSTDGIRVCYLPERNVYYVMGKALVWCAEWEKMVEDAEVAAPGPPDVTPEQWDAEHRGR